jgi:hypothetical protein
LLFFFDVFEFTAEFIVYSLLEKFGRELGYLIHIALGCWSCCCSGKRVH